MQAEAFGALRRKDYVARRHAYAHGRPGVQRAARDEQRAAGERQRREAPVVVDAIDVRVEDTSGVERGRVRRAGKGPRQIGAARHRLDRSGREDLAAIEQQQVRGEPHDVVKIVRDEHDGRIPADPTALRALPGVHSVAAMSGLPPLRNVNANDTDFEHIPNNLPPGEAPPQNVDFWQFVSVGYTDTMGIPVVAGRAFTDSDRTGAPVALVNEALVRRFFEGRSPLGARVKPGVGDALPWMENLSSKDSST